MKKRLALSVPHFGYNLPEHVGIAKEAEDLGYTDAWSFEVDGQDCFAPLALFALHSNMRIGTAIANVYTRGPATLAQSAASIADLAPGRFELGIGSGSQPIVEQWNSMKFTKPATRVKEMVQFLRPALAGERVVFEGKTFTVNGFRLSTPPEIVPRIHVAALRENMLKVAGEVGDGAIINWLSAEDCKKSIAVVREAAAKAGRDPEKIEITARLMVNIDPPSPEADVMRRRHINAYLQVPVYKAFHQWLGRSEELKGMWESWDAGDRKGAVANTPEQVVDDLIVHGTPEQRNEHVQRYLDAGVDTAFLSWFTFEPDPQKRREMIHQAMVEMSPKNSGVKV
ncbi:MAG: LLM class F420-dependent oxidoreductase [bacterium]